MYLIHEIESLIKSQGYALVSVVGSGGKTTLLYSLLEAFRSRVSTVITTTTMMFEPSVVLDELIFLEGKSLEENRAVGRLEVKKSIKNLGLFERREGNKVKGIDPEFLDALVGQEGYLLMLNEADGAKGKPLKAYGSHEPVIPQKSNLVVIVMGLDGLLQPLTEEWVHRSALFSELTGLKLGEDITREALVKIISHPKGFMKDIPLASKVAVVLNKWDALRSTIDFKTFAQCIFESTPRVDAVLVTALQQNREIYVFERGQNQ